MLRWPFRLWVLLLALLLQIGRGQALLDDPQAVDLGHLPLATAGEADAPEETQEGSSLVDEAFEVGMSSSNSPALWRQAPGAKRRCADRLSRGRPASDTPFKPPRA